MNQIYIVSHVSYCFLHIRFFVHQSFLSDRSLFPIFFLNFFGISLVCHISVESAVHVIQETEGTHRLSVLQRLLTAAGTFASSAEENLMQGKLPMVPFSALVSEG